MRGVMREVKVVACWVASWAAGLGVFWIAIKSTDHVTGDAVAYFAVASIILGIAAAMGAWIAVARWWPE